MFKYPSVRDYFEAEYPELAEMLNNSGAFWPQVRSNTITNLALIDIRNAHESIGSFTSTVYRASKALLDGRVQGKVANV